MKNMKVSMDNQIDEMDELNYSNKRNSPFLRPQKAERPSEQEVKFGDDAMKAMGKEPMGKPGLKPKEVYGPVSVWHNSKKVFIT